MIICYLKVYQLSKINRINDPFWGDTVQKNKLRSFVELDFLKFCNQPFDNIKIKFDIYVNVVRKY